MGRGDKVDGTEIELGYPHPRRMDGGLARAGGCGWEFHRT